MSSSAERPTVVRRVACMLYEALLLIGVVFIAGLVFQIAVQTRNTTLYRLELQIVLFLVIGSYFVWFWSKGQTLAMKTWHLHLRMPNGARVPPRRALLRYLLAWLWLLPPMVIASILQLHLATTAGIVAAWMLAWALPGQLSHNRQYLHDTWSGTEISYVKPPKISQPPEF